MSGTNPAQDRLDRLAGYDARDYEPAQRQYPDPATTWGRESEAAWRALPEGMYTTNGERSAFDAGFHSRDDEVALLRAALAALPTTDRP